MANDTDRLIDLKIGGKEEVRYIVKPGKERYGILKY